MFFRRPVFYLAPDAEGGAAAERSTGSDAGEITDDEVAEVEKGEGGDGEGEAEGGESAEGSLAARIEKPTDLTEVWKQHKLDGLPNDPQQLLSQYQAGVQAQREAQDLKNQLIWQMHNAQQMQRQPAQPAQQQAVAKMFDLPEFDKGWLDLVTRDADGNLVAKNGVDPSLPQKINAYVQARESALNSFLDNPIGLLQQHMTPIIQQQAQQIAAQQLQEYARLRELNQFEQQNAAWIFQNGSDISQGITPAAQRWNTYYGEAVQMRHPAPAQYAQRCLDADAYQMMLTEQAQQGTQQQRTQTAKEKDMSFLKRAAAQGNRGQSLPSKTTPKPPQNGRKPFASLAKRLADLPPGDLDSI